MGFTDYKLRYQIEGDNSKLKSAIAESEKSFSNLTRNVQSGAKSAASEVSNVVSAFTGDRLSGAASQVTSLADAFGAIPGPAGLAVGAVAGFGTAVVGAGTALFEFTKKAADYGSVIHDASDKTGLHAETLSAMDLAAKQSGTTLDTVTAALAKFAKNVSAGKDELKAFGITPKQAIADLDGSLAKVFKRIVEAKPGYEQIVLAQKAFGKSGADLLPFIKQFDGDLPRLIAHAKQLGLTLSDEDARAADEFGDQMTQLDEQIAAAARTLGREMMPVFLDWSQQVSGWLSENKNEVKVWGDAFAHTLIYVKTWIDDLVLGFQILDEWSSNLMNTDKYYKLVEQEDLLRKNLEAIRNGTYVYQQGGAAGQVNELTTPYTPTTQRTNTPFPDFTEKAAKAPKNLGSSTYTEMEKFFRAMGAVVTDAKRPEGSLVAGTGRLSKHGTGEAVDVRTRDKTDSEVAAIIAKAIEHGYRIYDERHVAGVDPHLHVEANTLKASTFGSAASYGGAANLAALQSLDLQRRNKAGGTDVLGGAVKTGQEAALAQFQKDWEFKKEIQKAGVDYLLTQAEREISLIEETGASYTEASQKTKAAADLKKQQSQDEIDALEEYRDEVLRLADGTTDRTTKEYLLAKAEETRRQIELKTIAAQIAAIKINDDQHDSLVKLTAKYYDLADGLKEAESATEEFIKATNGGQDNVRAANGTGSQGPPTLLSRFLDASGLSDFKSNVESFKSGTEVMMSAASSLGDMLKQAFGEEQQALESAIAGWLLYGQSIGAAMKKATAAVLAQLAVQAAMKAVYYTAEGVASLFWNPGAAAGFFEAAALMAIVAAGAGVGAYELAGGKNRGKQGGGGSGSSSYSPSSSQHGINQHPSPYSRVSDDAYISGDRNIRTLADQIGHLHEAVRGLNQKIGSMPAHEVLSRAAQQRPGIIGRQVVKDIRTHADIGTNMLKASGQRK